jgi:hypothetical protein
MLPGVGAHVLTHSLTPAVAAEAAADDDDDDCGSGMTPSWLARVTSYPLCFPVVFKATSQIEVQPFKWVSFNGRSGCLFVLMK